MHNLFFKQKTFKTLVASKNHLVTSLAKRL